MSQQFLISEERLDIARVILFDQPLFDEETSCGLRVAWAQSNSPPRNDREAKQSHFLECHWPLGLLVPVPIADLPFYEVFGNGLNPVGLQFGSRPAVPFCGLDNFIDQNPVRSILK